MKKLLLILLLLCVFCVPYARAQTGPGSIQLTGEVRVFNAVTVDGSLATPFPSKQYGAVKIRVSISAGTATINFEGRMSSADTFSARKAVKESDTANTLITSTTSSGTYIVYLAGDEQFNARVSNCSSCTVTAYARGIPSTGRALYEDGGSGGGGSGTVTDVSIVSANGISGTVADSTTTPAITLNVSALDAAKIADGSVSNAEFQRLDGVTSAIQTQLNAKLATTGSGASLTFPGSLSIASGKTATVSNTLTLAGTDGSTLNVGAGGTLGTGAFAALGATRALDNLASVAINSALLPATDASIALGSGSKEWTNVFLSGQVKFNGIGGDAVGYTNGVGPTFPDSTTGFALRFNTQSLSTDRIVTWPNAAGTVALTANNLSAFASTTSAQFLGVISDETGGAGNVVGSASPSLTGTVAISGATTTGPDTEVSITGDTFARVAMGINITDVPRISFGPGNAARDTFLERAGVATLRHGAPDAAAPVAQTDIVQNVVAGTSNTAGVDRTFAGSQGTGTGSGGMIVFKTAQAGSTGSTQNALTTRMTINPGTGPTVNITGGVTVSGDISTSGGDVFVAAGKEFYFSGRSTIASAANGNIRLANFAENDFGLLQLGGTSNSYNAIGRDAVNGFTLQSAAGTTTWNDGSTAGSGTVANRYLLGIAAPTLTATNSSVTDTVASTVYIGGAPTASTNTTIGTAYALNVASGNVLFGGSLSVSGGINAIAGGSTSSVKAGGALFDHYADASTTHTDGTEDDLYSDSVPASTLNTNGHKLRSVTYVNFVGSATAARRLKAYFAGTLIFDSGALTMSLGGDFWVEALVIRESSSVVRTVVSVTTTSASTVPYVTYTRITGLTLTNANTLKTTGIASGTGALSGDISTKTGFVEFLPAQ